MINWQHIADLLTEKWYTEGKLPVRLNDAFHKDVEYNYVYSTEKALLHGYRKLRYARTELWYEPYSIPETPFLSIRGNGDIDPSAAFREIWPLLTEEEKTAIMAETLGFPLTE